jgi:formamidopyrimidine-DNA glycosylase
MPELPDVETFRRRVESTFLRQKIAAVRVNDRRLLRDTSPRSLVVVPTKVVNK